MASKIKCNFCAQYFKKPERDMDIITILGVKLCSKSCRRSLIAKKNREKKLKLLNRKKKVKEKKSKTPTVLKKKLWKIVSEYIRRRDSNEEGIGICCSCGNSAHWKKLQAGHYIASGSSSFHRYTERNIHAQCMRCNVLLNGNVLEYREFMIKKYDITFADWLYETRNNPADLGSMALQELIVGYEKKLNDLK